MNALLAVLLAVLYVEAVTEVFVASSLFHGLRDRIARRGGLLAEFVHCGYCVSVWTSITVAWALPRLIIDHPVDCFFRIFIVHRLANVLHELWSRWFHRVPWTVVLNRIDQYQPTMPQMLGQDNEGQATPPAAEEGPSA